MSFTDQVQESTSPWNDPRGFWSAYNAALASTFEVVYGLVADTGDPDQAIVATLGSLLSTSAPITEIPVQSVAAPIASGATVSLAFGQSLQDFELSADASVGDGFIAVESLTPNYPFPIGTPVQLQYVPGWSILLDPNNCPGEFLTFLGQFNGTVIPPGLDATTARAKIIGESAQHRGTTASVVSAVQRNLTGTQSVVIEERIDGSGNPNAYWFVVVVRPEEVISVQALTADVNAVKPGGVMWTLIQTDGWTISQMEASQVSISALEANFVTITGLENDRPGT